MDLAFRDLSVFENVLNGRHALSEKVNAKLFEFSF